MSEYLAINPKEIQTKILHGHLLSAVGPRPIGFISTVNRDGVSNLAPFSFFNVFSANPPIAIFSPARRVRDNTTKHSLENVYEVPEAVINVVSYDIVHQMNLASCEYDNEVDEFVKAGFTGLESDLVRPLRVAESPVQLECKVVEIKPLAHTKGAGQLVFCEVLRMHINQRILNPAGQIDADKIDLVGRMGGMNYVRASGESLFTVPKPGMQPGMGIDQLPESIRSSTVLSGNDLGQLGMIETLPDKSVLQAFAASEGQAYLDKVVTEADRHAGAKQLIAEGKVDFALKLLLS